MNTSYYKTDQIIYLDNNSQKIIEYYSSGFVFTRIAKGLMNQTRSLRINLNGFGFNSENKRILNKNANLKATLLNLPIENYSWHIHKMGKEFYTTKFGDKTMSASKLKEMFCDLAKSNMNSVIEYSINNKIVGYCLCYFNNKILHYAFPFYDLSIAKENSLGMAMIIKAIQIALEKNIEFFYLGSVIDVKSKYKLQFNNMEWFNTTNLNWSTDIEYLKTLLN